MTRWRSGPLEHQRRKAARTPVPNSKFHVVSLWQLARRLGTLPDGIALSSLPAGPRAQHRIERIRDLFSYLPYHCGKTQGWWYCTDARWFCSWDLRLIVKSVVLCISHWSRGGSSGGSGEAWAPPKPPTNLRSKNEGRRDERRRKKKRAPPGV